MNPTRDWCTRDNAEELAFRIRAYWKARGKTVETAVYSLSQDSQKAVWCVTSDLKLLAPEKAPE